MRGRATCALEALAITLICLLTAALGLSNLAAPSLWHDELVHVYVAKSIAAGDGPVLPSGVLYPNALGYAHVLAAFIYCFGDSEFVVRLPSVLFSVGTVLTLYALARAWLGRGVALATALLLATSPWHVAWARQARMYEMQALCYLLMLAGVWGAITAQRAKAACAWASLALFSYIAGMLCSFHSALFLGAPAVWAAGLWWINGKFKFSREAAVMVACAVLAAATALVLYLNPNPVDQQAVFHGIGPEMPDPLRADRLYYVQWFIDNLSTGCTLLAFIGLFALLWRRDKQSALMVLAFVVPLIALTFFIGYRRPRFIYFAYPFFVLPMAYALYVIVRGVIGHRSAGTWHWMARAGAAIILARTGWSLLLLTGDSLETASGHKNTLATSHPEWRHAGEWVRQHRAGAPVLTTTYLAALYYAGGADDWFPNRYLPGEVQESGKPGLASLQELQAFVASHPRGYFLSEIGRFETWAGHTDVDQDIVPELEWIQANMRRVPEASTSDVNVYAWGESP